MINEGNYEIPKQLKLSKQAISLINGLLQFDQDDRLSIEELIFHEFLTLEVEDFQLCELNLVNKSSGDIQLNNRDDVKKIWYGSNTAVELHRAALHGGATPPGCTSVTMCGGDAPS